jgi:hypothetical protein
LSHEEFGQNDARIQMLIYLAMDWDAKTADQIMNAYDTDVAYAVLATALGEVAGQMQALYDNHCKECENCAAKKHNIYELVVKNFGAAFNRAKRGQENVYAETSSDADAMLERLFKGHKK